RVPYDIPAVQKRMEKAGLPFPLIERLGAGRYPACCSASLQVGILKLGKCPPEGGRYIDQDRISTQAEARSTEEDSRLDAHRRTQPAAGRISGRNYCRGF